MLGPRRNGYLHHLLLALVLNAGWSCPGAAAKPILDIAIIVDEDFPELMPLRRQLENEVTAVVGEDAVIRFDPAGPRGSNYDAEVARRHYRDLVRDEGIDLILGFGAAIHTVLLEQESFPKPTILFGALNSDIAGLPTSDETSGIPNFTYLLTAASYARDLDTLYSLRPFRRLGVLMLEPRTATDAARASLDDYAGRKGIEYEILGLRSPAELGTRLEQYDAVYLAEGWGASPALKTQIARILAERRIPSMTNTIVDDVHRGWLATNRSDTGIDQFIRRVALTIEAYVNGTPLAELPVFVENEDQLTLNFNVAALVGVPIPFSLVATTNFVGEFDNVLSEERYSLPDVIQRALADNLDLRATSLDVELEEQSRRGAWSGYLPDLTASARAAHVDPDLAVLTNGQNPEFSANASLTLTQVLFSPDATSAIQAQNDLVTAQRQAFRAEELDLVVDAAAAYFQVLRAKSNLEIQAANLQVTKENLRVAEQQFEAGESGRSDVLRFRSQMAQNQQRLVEALNGLSLSFVALNRILENPIDREVDVEDARIGEGAFATYGQEISHFLDDPAQRDRAIRFLVAEAHANSPELAQLDATRRATDHSLFWNGSGRFTPTLSVQGQLNRRLDEWGEGVLDPNPLPESDYNVGLSLSVPLFDQNLKAISHGTARRQRAQLDLRYEAARRDLEQGVRVAVLDIHDQISNLKLSTISEETAAETLDLVRASYAAGAVSVVDLIDAQNNLRQAQLARANAAHDFLESSINLERRVGYFFLLHTPEENAAFVARFSEFEGGTE